MFRSGAQIRAARALLGWTQKDLAEAADLHPKAVAYWERKDSMSARREEVGAQRIRHALADAGVEPISNPVLGVGFIPEREFSDSKRARVMGS